MNLIEIIPVLKNLQENGGCRFHMAKTRNYKEKGKDCVDNPLDAIAKGDSKWLEWQEYKSYNEKRKKWRNRFVKKYIVSFAQITDDIFLFGGIFEIKEKLEDRYKVELMPYAKSLIGRLVIRCKAKPSRVTVFTPKYLIDQLVLKEIYPIRYNGEVFKSINLINLDYSALEIIFKNETPEWKSVLSKTKGIYLLTDKDKGKRYVGSASGTGGIWERWSQYINDCTGGDTKLIELVNEFGEEYFKTNFKFTILETTGSAAKEDEILKLESLWKDKLLSRNDKFGYN